MNRDEFWSSCKQNLDQCERGIDFVLNLGHSIGKEGWLLNQPTAKAQAVGGEKTASLFFMGLKMPSFFISGDIK